MKPSAAPHPAPSEAPASPPAGDGPPPQPGRWPSRDSIKGSPALWSWPYRVVVLWGSVLTRSYYRVEMRGEALPLDRPVLLVQNHSNGLVDAHLLMSATCRPIRLLVKYKLLKAPLVGWMLRAMNSVPMYRKKDGVDTRQNATSFDTIDSALRENSVIALFPEGESLNSIGVRPLKSGVARMAISADESPEGSIGLVIVPVGVTYDDRDRFRSTVRGVVGEPIEVAPIIESCGETWRRAIPLIMDRIRVSLESLTLHAQTDDEHATAIALERILADTDVPLGLRRRAALASFSAYDGEDAERRGRAIRELADRLKAADLRGDDVLDPAPSLLATWAPTFWAVPLVLLGAPVWVPPIVLGMLVARYARTPDKIVTLRMLTASTFQIVWLPFLLGMVWIFQGGSAVIWAAATVVVALLTFTRSIDALRSVARAARRRSLQSSPQKAESLRAAIRSIREAFPTVGAGH